MKCNNYFIFSVGITALCHFAYFTQIVPCNVRLKFNKLTGDTVTFEAPGGRYTMEVEKGRNMSQIGGDGWARFLARMRLTGGELISFSFRAERPKLAVIYLNLVEDDEDDEDDEDNEDPLDEDDEDPLHEAILAQRTRLSEEEVSNLWDIIPPRADFVGVPFVTRLTNTMVDRHDMVCYTYKCKLFDELHSVQSNDMVCCVESSR